MLSIRLSRVGKKKAPIYRVVVMPKTRDPWAKTTAVLGNYDPRKKTLTVKAEEVQKWIGNGAECSDTVWNIFVENKIVEGKKRSVTHISGKRKGDMEKAVAEKKAKEDAAKAKADAAKAAEEEAKVAAAEAAKAEAEAAKAAAAEAKTAAEAVVEAPVVEASVVEDAAPVVEAPSEVPAE